MHIIFDFATVEDSTPIVSLNQSKNSPDFASQIAGQVIAGLKPMLQHGIAQTPIPPIPDKNHTTEIETLRQQNTLLQENIAQLKAELASLKAKLNGPAASPASHDQQNRPQADARPAKQQGNGKPDRQPDNGNGNANGKRDVDEEKAEKWVKANPHEWLDEPCPFRRAGGRTWRQMAENFGEKISMNGKGPQSPRAYLHAIESWQQCNPWSRVKAKVALEIGKNNGNHYNRPEEIGY